VPGRCRRERADRDPRPGELMGQEPVPLGGVKEPCLLAALAVRCGQAVGTAGLVDARGG
jgi:hypothetical protein